MILHAALPDLSQFGEIPLPDNAPHDPMVDVIGWYFIIGIAVAFGIAMVWRFIFPWRWRPPY